MGEAVIRLYADLMAAAVYRRKNLLIRAATAILVALIGVFMVGWLWIWQWLLPYLALLAVEAVMMRPTALHRWQTPTVFGAIFISALFASSGAAFCWIAVPTWDLDLKGGPAIAQILLIGGILNHLVISRGSRLAFLVSSLPYALTLTGLILWDPSMPEVSRLLMSLGMLLLASYIVAAWTISERVNAEQRATAIELDARRRQAETAVEAKSAFVAMISHELRTPISAILACAAEVERDPREASRHGRLIGDAGRMMTVLLNDLLDLAKLDAGRLKIDTSLCDIRLLFADLYSRWRPAAQVKGLEFHIDGLSDLPERVHADPLRIEQILNNLLSNAIKFTESGSVSLLLNARSNEEYCSLQISVIDTGAGLSPEQISRLFRPFEQSDHSIARKHGGTGLGLAISRELAELMGGTLDVVSTADQGATFRLELTLPVASAAPETASSGPEMFAADIQVLVVDDHHLNRQALHLMMAQIGITPMMAENAAQALALLSDTRFDIVLMDVQMQGMDGREATRLLRSQPGANQSIPVIAITGKTSPEDIAACRKAGMDFFVSKPFNPTSLYGTLSDALSASRRSDEHQAA